MKIKIWDRLILLLGALLSIAAGVVLFAEGLRIKNAADAVLAAVLAAFGGYLIVFLRRYHANRQDFVIQRTDSGELRIAVKAIENQVLKCVDLHEEIQDSSIKIINGREGVVVELAVTLDNNISIPLAVASLQKQIKQYLVASSGIEVKEVRVSVESTQDSPDAEAQETECGQPGEKAAAKEKKAPLHQRLFGRADEPAIVPEPPKEEEGVTDEETATEAETEEAAEVEEERGQPVAPLAEPLEETEIDLPAEKTEPEISAEDAAPFEEPEEEPLPPEEKTEEALPEEPQEDPAEPEALPDPLPEAELTPEGSEAEEEALEEEADD